MTQTSVKETAISFVEIFDESAWADMLTTLPTSTAYLAWWWGKYKERRGWTVHRIRVCDANAGAFLGCFQMQKRRLGIVTILLIQGGIQTQEPSDTNYYEILQSFLRQNVTSKPLTVVIVDRQAGWSEGAQLGLLRSNFSPVLNSVMYTYFLDRASGAMSGERLSRNWRHNLKRAQNSKGLSSRWIDDPKERMTALERLESFYNSMRRRKAFAAAIDFDVARDLIVANEDFKIVEAWLEGEVIATRVGFVCNDHVLDFLAASGDAAKNTYANYLLLWEMIRMAHSKGKLHFDCGGINPAESMGVFNFKKGLGGRLVVNGPLWLHGSSWLVKHVARLMLSRRH